MTSVRRLFGGVSSPLSPPRPRVGLGADGRRASGGSAPKPKPAAAAPMVDPMPPGASIYLSIVHVKPGSWEDYVALQKSEAMPGLQKGGRAARQAWRSQSFGQSYGWHTSIHAVVGRARRRAPVAEGARRGRRERPTTRKSAQWWTGRVTTRFGSGRISGLLPTSPPVPSWASCRASR